MLSRIMFVVALVLCFLPNSYAGLQHDSQLRWVTAESAHFRIHYHDGEKVLANKTLRIAESVFHQLTPTFDWLPSKKTEIVLSDETDFSNGLATPLPSNRMMLFATSPHRVNSLEDHDGWLETLILHEFVHILHLDKAIGEAKNVRSIFGRFALFFPNLFMPAWMHEGLATYYETNHERGIGRGQSSYFQMMMRIEVAAGIKPLRQINQPMVTWPLLTSRYLYGVYFYQFIADTYGEDKLMAIVESYSDHVIPFRINGLYEDVLGKDLSQLWDEFQSNLNKQFQPQLQAMQQKGLDQVENLTQTGDLKRSLLQSEDGRTFFVQDHMASGASLVVIEAGGKTKVLAELNRGGSLDWHESAGLLIAQPDYCNNANRFYDLYQVDSQTGKQTRLTFCKRYIAATWSTDGQSIVAVRNNRGSHAIHLLSAKGVLQQVLWQGSGEETLSGIDWSADGKTLLSSVWRKGRGWNIEEFDIEAKFWLKRTSNTSIKTDARYVQQTRDIVFSMDKGEVYNIYRLLEHTNEVLQLTYVLGGAFSPFITVDNQLLSINYHALGFDVAQLAKVNADQVFMQPSAQFVPIDADQPTPVLISDPVAYSPWDTLKPTWWFPSLLISNQGAELAATVSGTDVLNRHRYDLFTGYQSVSQSAIFVVDYIYDRWFPLLKLHADKREEPSFDGQYKLIALQNKQRLDVEMIFPWLRVKEKWSVHLGLNHQSSALSWLDKSYTSNFTGYQDSLAGLAMVYDTTEFYPRSVSDVVRGNIWSVLLESGALMNGDYQGHVGALAMRKYFDLSDEHVLAVRTNVGFGSSDARPYQLGGTQDVGITANIAKAIFISIPFNQRYYALRGYGQGLSDLSGQNMALVSAEYRFPVTRIERGWMAPPVGIHQVFGQVFVDAGRVGSSLNTATTYIGLGAELGGDFIVFYNLPIRIQLGYAKGLHDTIGGKQVYFRLGSSF